jgi:hypothetical protein
MKEPVTRVFIFEKAKRSPIFIIRKNLIPSDWETTARNISEYRALNHSMNASDSIRFETVSIADSIEHAQKVMADNGVADIFVTARGGRSEPVLGWLPDDRLRGV